MGYLNEENEGLNLTPSTLSEFVRDLNDKLALLTSPSTCAEYGLTLEEIRKPMLLIGKPGVGKTSCIISAVREINQSLSGKKKLGFKKILLGQTVVGSLSGIPVVRPDGSIVRVQIPDLPDAKRDGEYGVLLLDELTTADEMQIQPALGLTDDSRSLGEYTLPEHWIVVAAGNGPESTNFIRLDDMTISRFAAYFLDYSYHQDFRPYAHRTGLNEDIIAFLNFDPGVCVRVESNDLDRAGKMFPCPRTWERLSIELKIREASGRPVPPEEITAFAGRIIGTKAAREFGAFMQFKKDISYSTDKILAGTERAPEVGMPKETYHILLQALLKQTSQLIKEHGNTAAVPKELYPQVGNMLTWLLQFTELENKINAMIEIRNDIPALANLMLDNGFCNTYCPLLNPFFEENMALLLSSVKDLKRLRI